MDLNMTENEVAQVKKLIPLCDCWENGNCQWLHMKCPQQLSLTVVNCRHFREVVLPANRDQLETILEKF